MIALILRLLIFLAPVTALFLWLRWRFQNRGDTETLAQDLKKLQVRLIVLVGLTLVGGLGLYVTDDSRAPAGQIYIPSHMENGVLVPGQFISPEDLPDGADERGHNRRPVSSRDTPSDRGIGQPENTEQESRLDTAGTDSETESDETTKRDTPKGGTPE